MNVFRTDLGSGSGATEVAMCSVEHTILSTHCLVVIMESWSVQHRVFTYDSFVRNNESIVAVQREFRRHFNLARNNSVPTHNTILRAHRTVRTPENVERVRQAILRSPGRSALFIWFGNSTICSHFPIPVRYIMLLLSFSLGLFSKKG
ncbi:hypothetical protein J6590_027358 [Homalodisca vitripennis]|nr:hypothetical protein J6590_027358 [Homalodisca vitripennis]